MKSLIILIGLIILTSAAVTGQNFEWTHTNGPNGQRVREMVSPSDDSIFAAIYGGVYLSTDNGESWNAVNEGITDINIMALVQADDGTLFAGSIDGAVFRSTNNGQLWEAKASLPDEYHITDMTLAVNGDLIVGTYRDGLFRSSNGGDTWVEANTGLTDLHIAALITSPTGTSFVGTVAGPFRSYDNGVSWIPINTGLADTEVTGLAVNTVGHIYASVFVNEAVIYSTDEGDTWVGIGGAVGYSAYSVAVNADNDVFACSGSHLYFYDHNLLEWIQLYDDLPDGYFDPIFIQSDGDIFVGRQYLHAKGDESPATPKDDTLFRWGCALHRSTDNGIGWELTVTGLGYIKCTCLATNEDDLIIAGTFDYGLYRSSDNGITWAMSNDGNSGPVIDDIIIADNGMIFAATESGLYRSTDDGLSWERWDIGGYPWPSVSCLAVGDGDNIFAASNYGVHSSTDGGNTWALSTEGLPEYFYPRDMIVNSAGYVFAGDYSHGIYRSTDTGITWTEVNNGFTDLTIYCMAVNRHDELFVGTYFDGLFKSTDNGETWANLTTTPEFSRINELAVRDVSGYIYASSYDLDAIYRSTDGGYTWEPNDYGDAPSGGSDFYFDEDGNLYVAGFGIYRSSFNYKCGDINNDGGYSVGDVVYVVAYVFKGGPAPVPALDSGDANCDGDVNIGDAVYGISYIFKGGTRPCCP